MVSDHPRDEKGRWSRALDTTSGRAYWRSARELLASPDLHDALPAELAEAAAVGPDGMSRRDLLRLMGASFALAGLAGCNMDPEERILPYANRPPEVTPGLPNWYATSMVLDGFATGLLVQSYEGRPTKIEGNPEHPASLGATSVFEQASVLQLYDPDRMGAVERGGRRSTWNAFAREFRPAGRGDGLRFLMYPQSGPHVVSLIERVRERYPGARFCFESPLDRREVYRATQQLFGRTVEPQYDFAGAEVVLALDADFTAATPNAVRWAREFAAARRLDEPNGQMNRLYAVETAPTPTSSLADHRLAVAPSEVAAIGAAVLAEVSSGGASGINLPTDLRAAVERAGERVGRGDWVRAVARDLRARGGASIVIAGDRQPAEVHAIAHLLNLALGNVGQTVHFTEPALLDAGSDYSLVDLVDEMRRGAVEHLVILEANPSYTAPADLEFSRWLRQVPNSAVLSLYAHETARDAEWTLPASHYLESWGDARAYDGTASLVQPLIRPLLGGRTPAQILAMIAGADQPSAYDLVRDEWRERFGGGDFEQQWEASLQAGLVAGTEAPPVEVQPDMSGLADVVGTAGDGAGDRGFELYLERSPAVYDGRFANIGWLLELPDPTTKLTWDNAALVSPQTASELGVTSEDVVELHRGGDTLRAPVLVVPGHAERAVTLHLGWGREGAETLARGRGVNAYQLKRLDAPLGGELEVVKTGERYPLALTQRHQELHDRPIALHALLEEYREHPEFTEELRGPVRSLLPQYEYPGEHLQWAMTIDTSICTGCSACVVACQAENNVPIVGKEGVRNSREMHWLRIDRYRAEHEGRELEDFTVINQPMLCQHCEKAPCEYVCPVNATVHSPDGLNEMIYNRCVGTRFCSNNCPYKIRRFNWFSYENESPLKLQRNPQVTIRERGVMEKCTYCVQRIRRTGIEANIEDRAVRPGEVMTACQQVCPTRAIQFGALQHEDTEMVAWRKQPRMYEVLHEEGTQPRNAYLAKIVNPNEDVE